MPPDALLSLVVSGVVLRKVCSLESKGRKLSLEFLAIRDEIDLPKAHPPYRRYYDNQEYTKANIKQRNSKGDVDELISLLDHQKTVMDKVSPRTMLV